MVALTSTARWVRISPPVVWVIMLTLVLFFGETVPAGSIFDDDFTPPEPPSPQSPSTSPPSTPEASPAPLSAAFRVTRRPMLPICRQHLRPSRPVPPKPDQAHSRSLLKEVYAKELADRSPSARKAPGKS